MIVIKIDVTKLDKSRFFKGEKGTYCDLVLIDTPGGKYGDYVVKQGVTKEERQARVDMPILGNGKNVGTSKPPPKPRSRPEPPPKDLGEDDEIPF